MIKKTNETEDKVNLEIDNGHLEALKKITADYNIQDIEKTLGFIIAVMIKYEGKAIKIGNENFVPGEAIKKKEPVTPPEVTPVTE